MRPRMGFFLLILMALTCLSSCSTPSEPTSLRIGVALYRQDDTFIGTVAQQMERLAQEQEQGVKITLNFADAEGNQSTQNDQIDRFLSLSYDVICVNIVDRTAAAVIIDKAKAANVPVIFFNREPVEEDLERWEHAYYVGSMASVAGEIQGEIVADAWYAADSTMDRNGDNVLQYVMLEGEPGHQDALLRTEYSIRTLESSGIDTQRLASETADWDRGLAYTAMDEWISEFDITIELVLCNNDDMALGAVDAYLDAGFATANMPCIVGVDALDDALSAMESGALYGTVRNDAEGQASALINLSYILFSGGSTTDSFILDKGNYIWLSYTAITSE